MLTYAKSPGETIIISIVRNKWKFIGILVLLLLVGVLSSFAQNLQVNDSTAKARLTGKPANVIKQIKLDDLHFVKETGNYINFGIAGNEYKYFVIKVASKSGIAKQYLSIDNTSLDTISIYRIFNKDSSRLLYRGGCLLPYDNNRAYVWHSVPIEITTTPAFYLVAAKAAQKNINIQYAIITNENLEKKYQAYDRIILFYTGVVSMILFIVILASYLFRKSVFMVYAGYIICISVWIISHYGYLFPFVYPRIPVVNEIIKPLGCLGACYFLTVLLCKVFQQNLQVHQWLRKMLRALRYILPVLIACMMLLLFRDLSPVIKGILMGLWHIALLFSICLIVVTPLYFIRSGATAKIFSLAMLVVCLMALLQLFANSGYIKNYFINEHSVTMGSLVENFIISFGLFYSLLEENNEKKKQVIALEREQAQTLKKLISVQDYERKRIANDLHDNIGPLLAAIKINFRRMIDNKDELKNGLVHKTESIIDDSIAEIRNVAHNLMPKSLAFRGLIEALREYFEGIEQLYKTKIVFNHQVQSILQPEIQANIYRIICELVLNAVKHSDANELNVSMISNDQCINLGIKDDGKGFNVRSAEFSKSFGLQSAESRIQYMKGKFLLTTSPGKGTIIDMEIPL
jgi:signal transduction histidine kinase